MRICHVITRLIIGGAQENTLLTCEGLQDRGHEVLLLAGPDTGPEGSLWERAKGYGYKVLIIPSMHRAIRPLSEIKALRELRQALAGFNPDIIHTHSSKAGILGRLAAVGLPNAKVVHTIHGMSFNRTQFWVARHFYRLLEWVVAQHTDKFICVAQAMTEQALAAGLAAQEKFVTVYSGMQAEWFTPDEERRRQVRDQLGLGDEQVAVGTVARLFRNKGYEQLIPAIAGALKENEKLRFVWIGDGANRQEYLEMLERLGIRDHVHLTGLLTPSEAADQMQGFDLLAHCSQWEGLPRAVVQSLLLEIPVVCFDNDGASEVVRDQTDGRLVAFNDIEALTAAIVELAGDREVRAAMGKTGRQRCLQMFDHRTMVDQIERVYLQLR